MTHQQVIENFIKEGKGGRGTNVKANENMLYSQAPVRRWSQSVGYETLRQQAPLAGRLLMERASAKAKETDLAEARRLAAKHGFEIQEG
jgi:hypothetical protein